MNTTARFATVLSTLVLASAPALAGTPSGVGEFALQSTPAATSTLSREAVMAEALRSDVLDMNGEVAQSTPQAPRSMLTREAVRAMALRAAERTDYNSEVSM